MHTKSVRALCHDLLAGRWVAQHRGSDAFYTAVGAGLLAREGEETMGEALEDMNGAWWALSPAGVAVAKTETEARAAARAKRNASARVRNGALRDLGLVRTAHGWE